MKVNWKYLKKPSVIIGAIVLFFVLLWLLNRSGGASAGTAVANGGPDPNAVLAAQTQLAGMSIQAGIAGQQIALEQYKTQQQGDVALAVAQLNAGLETNRLAAEQNIAASQLALQSHVTDLNFQQSLANNQFALDYAQAGYDSALNMVTVNAQLQAHMADQQLEAFKFSTLASIIPSLKKGKRDNAFFALSGTTDVIGLAKLGQHSGGSGTGDILGIVSPITRVF